MIRATTSIRWRLTAWFGTLLAVVLLGFWITAYRLNYSTELARIDEALEARVSALQDDLRLTRPPDDHGGPFSGGDNFEGGPRRKGRGPDGRDGPGGRDGFRRGERSGSGEILTVLSARTAALFNEADRSGYYYGMWGRNGSAPQVSANGPKGLAYPAELAPEVGRFFNRTRAGFREAIYLTERGHCALVGISLETTQAEARRFGWLLAAAGAVVLAAGVGGAWGLTTRALEPVKAIGATATRIAAGNLAERIAPQSAASELSELAAVLNATFARLDAAFAEQRNFTSDASHELRTPLAAMITAMQTTLARERTGEDYREALAACLRAAQQMRRLTESLLALARFDAGQEPLTRSAVDLAAVARDAVELVGPLAEQRGMKVETDLGAAPAQGDGGRLGQVVNNLLANAVHHGRDGGRVRVTTRTEGTEAVLTVTDDGPGIAPEDLPHVFKRFYRADKARSRETGRSGLGLAISKAVVEAHGGTIAAASVPGAGATFTVRLPG